MKLPSFKTLVNKFKNLKTGVGPNKTSSQAVGLEQLPLLQGALVVRKQGLHQQGIQSPQMVASDRSLTGLRPSGPLLGRTLHPLGLLATSSDVHALHDSSQPGLFPALPPACPAAWALSHFPSRSEHFPLASPFRPREPLAPHG